MKIAYLGPQGTFSEEAAIRFFTGHDVEWIICDSIFDVLECVAEQQADKGIVPIENALEGTINISLDGILANRLFISSEAILPISLHLLAHAEVNVADIREVWSIQPALDQCKDFIRSIKAKRKQYNSTAAAALAIKEEARPDVAAIASEWAAQTFGLEIIARDIQDLHENRTRFVVVSKEREVDAPTKTMIMISPHDEYPGMLSAILNVFSALSINLSWIESRPTKKRLGTYNLKWKAASMMRESKKRSKSLKRMSIVFMY
jgi:prephenate dehydratase